TATANFIDVARADLTLEDGLSMLKGLNVSDDALTSNAYACKQQVVWTMSGAASSAGQLTFSYTSASGEAKSVSLNYADAATQAAIGNNFVSTFADKLKADGVAVETDGAGALTFTATGTGVKLGQVNGGAGLDS